MKKSIQDKMKSNITDTYKYGAKEQKNDKDNLYDQLNSGKP